MLVACLAARRLRHRAARPSAPAAPVEVQILGINDFHGNLEPPRSAIDVTEADGASRKVPAGGVAYLAGAAQGAARTASRTA